MGGDSGVTFPLTFPNPRRVKIDSIDRRLTAFAIFSEVYLQRFPSKASDLICYQQTIRNAHQKFAGTAWYAYDIEFRKRLAKNPASLFLG